MLYQCLVTVWCLIVKVVLAVANNDFALGFQFTPKTVVQNVTDNRLLDEQMQSPEVFCEKNVFLKFFEFYRKTPVRESHFNKVAGLKTCPLFKKESSTGVFHEICEFFKNTCFEEHL